MKQGHIFGRAEFINRSFRALDLLTIILSGLLVYYIRLGEVMLSGPHPIYLAMLCFFTVTIFSWLSIYTAWRGKSVYWELIRVSTAWLAVMLAISSFTFLTKTGEDYSRLWVGWTFFVAYFGLIGYRLLARIALGYVRASGFNQKHVIIIGAGKVGRHACSAMHRETWAGLTPVALFDDNEDLFGKAHDGVMVLGDLEMVVPFIESKRSDTEQQGFAIDQVWITLPLKAEARIHQLQSALLNTATNVYFIPDLFCFSLSSYKIDEMVGLPVMNMSARPIRGGRAIVKRFEDIVISSMLIVMLSPLFVVVAALIKYESPGPFLFKQRRYGKDGKEILVWKFRSMQVTEDGGQIKQAQKGDNRVTKVGAWIRKLSIDELPQLFNVLQGRMSLVGPRPHAVAHNEYYRTKVKGYMVRHQMRPGITGWAQVNGSRGETVEVEDMERRTQYDLEYIRNWSIFLDIRIFFMTLKTLINFKDTY